MTKICKKCGEEKSLEEFSKHSEGKLRNVCKKCCSEENRDRYLKNKEYHSEKCKDYYIKNNEKIKTKSKEYSEKNSETLKEKKKKYREENKDILSKKSKEYYQQNKEKYKERSKKYKEDNKEKLKIKNKVKNKKYRDNNKEEVSKNFKEYYNVHKEYFKEHRKRYHESEKGKAQKLKWCNEYNAKNKHVVLWRSLLRRMIVQLKTEKTGNTESMLGYSAMDLKMHIENNWLSGMTWENYGEWHVDHIRSVATFESIDLSSVVNALSNLNPMWATNRTIDGIFYEGNLNKGKKYN